MEINNTEKKEWTRPELFIISSVETAENVMRVTASSMPDEDETYRNISH